MADANATKGSLARSMKQLMSEKSFAKISITDICDGCGMNRKSFYYHFKDKYDLMNWIFYTDFISLAGSRTYENGWDLLEAVCELFYKDRSFYRSAFRTEGQNSFREYLLESMIPIVEFMFQDIWQSMEKNDIIAKLFCEVYILAVATWVEDGCRYEAAAFVSSVKEVIRRLAADL